MYYLVLICALFCTCTPPHNNPRSGIDSGQASVASFPYRINEPDKVYELPPALKEASGLSATADPNLLLIIQDEQGVLYYFDLRTGVITKEVKFYEQGDFEGVEVISEELIYAVKSSGTLYKIQLSGGVATTTKISTALDKSFDVEGLCADAPKKLLYLACKGPGSDSSSLSRKVYAYDVQLNKVDPKPYLEVTEDMTRAYFSANDRAVDFVKETALRFGPSGIAVHPVSKEFYLLASSGKLLMVVDPKTQIIRHIEKIDKKVLPQPEGITFDQAGNLFICSEGKKDQPGILASYQYRPN